LCNTSTVLESESGPRILIADDSDFVREVIAHTLSDMGLKCLSARNGKEAWEKLEMVLDQAELSSEPIEAWICLLIIDVDMPVMNGYDLTKMVKSNECLKNIPVILYFSPNKGASPRLYVDVGAEAYIANFGPRELMLTLQRVLGGRGNVL